MIDFSEISFTLNIWMSGAKAPDLMPTDCSVLRTPTILPIVAYRGIIIPLLYSYLGGSRGLSPTYEQAHVGLDLLTLASNIFYYGRRLLQREGWPTP